MKKLVAIMVLLLGLGGLVVLGAPAMAYTEGVCTQFPDTEGCDPSDDVFNRGGNLMSTMFLIVGIVSVCGIIYGAVMFVTSAGNPDSVQKGKSAIMFSCVGLIVAALAYAIVNFVLGAVE